MNIGAIILAAGSSSRMGKSKQLLIVHGEALLHKTVRVAAESRVANVTVVLGSDEKNHKHVIKDLNADIVENINWQKGMGNSLKAGLSHLMIKEPSTQAVIILVCDQPAITSEHLNQLINRHNETKKAIVASFYSGAPGVPALIDRSLFDELASIDDAHGAKKVIQRHQQETALVDFPEGEIDLDTPEEYENYLKRK